MLHLHHIHKKKKRQKSLKKHEDSALDYVIYFAAVASPLMTAPQVYEVWIMNRVEGVSVATWVGYLVFAVIWLVYGLVHKSRPIVVSNALWVIADILVVLGVYY